jgi:RNA polymerase sigma factor FliA
LRDAFRERGVTAVPVPESEARIDVLWARYRSAGDPEARDQLLARHLGLVHHVAREVSRRIPSIELGELVSAGALGLMKALDSFDLTRGLAFSTYAVLRIRGAILDDLRSRDSTPRSVRMKRRKIETVAAALEAELGRAPAPKEIAERLEIDLATFWKWKDAVGIHCEAEVPTNSKGQRASRDAENHADPGVPLASQQIVDSEHVGQLRSLISRLPEQQRRVLALYYYEELNLRQVGEVLNVSESRVSQIRSQALRRLKTEILAGSLTS